MAKNFSDCYDYVCPDVPMAPLPIVLNAIQQAVIDFCEQSLIWRTELQQILVLAPVSTALTTAAAVGATSVVVDSVTSLADLDTVTIDLSDGTKWRGHISGTPAGFTVTLDGALPLDALQGATFTKLVDLYAVTVPTGTAIAKGLQAWLNDTLLDPISPDDRDVEVIGSSYGWANWRTDTGLSTKWYMPDDNTVGLVLAPNAAGNLRINAALKPAQSATNFPQWIFERYINDIAKGAIATLQLTPKKPYTDKELGQWNRQQFQAAIGKARVRMAKGNTRASLRTHSVYGLR